MKVHIIHDYGLPGHIGVIEYSAAEVEAKGGIEALKAEYEQADIFIYRIDFAEEEKNHERI